MLYSMLYTDVVAAVSSSSMLMMFRRSERIQDAELRDLAQKIRLANQLKEHEDSELLVVSERTPMGCSVHTVHYSTVLCSTVLCSTLQYSTVLCSTVQYSTVQYSTAQHSTVHYSTVQYSPLQYSTFCQCSRCTFNVYLLSVGIVEWQKAVLLLNTGLRAMRTIYCYHSLATCAKLICLAVKHWPTYTVPTGQGKEEEVREFEWSGKVRQKSGKMKNWCRKMSDFQAKMHQIWFPLPLRPRPHWGSLQHSPDPLAALNIAP